jgi:hypothetical protein
VRCTFGWKKKLPIRLVFCLHFNIQTLVSIETSMPHPIMHTKRAWTLSHWHRTHSINRFGISEWNFDIQYRIPMYGLLAYMKRIQDSPNWKPGSHVIVVYKKGSKKRSFGTRLPLFARKTEFSSFETPLKRS